MLKGKLLGGILLSTMEGFTLPQLTKLTNSKKADVKKELDILIKEKKIVLIKKEYRVV
jgi:hypothetical protein